MAIFRPGSSQARASTTGHSIRGKISGPIPVSNSLDDEFPFRSPAAVAAPAIAAAPPPVDQHRNNELPPPPPPPLPPPPPPPQQQQQQSMPAADPPPSPSPRYTDPHNTDLAPSPLRRAVASMPMPNPTPDPPARFSVASVASRGGSGHQGGRDGPQRKRSTLRTTLGRLFGRKKREDGGRGSGEPDIPESPTTAPSPNHSDAPGPGSKYAGGAQEAESKRSTSLPVAEYDRALRSHSVGPITDDATAIESLRNSLQTDFGYSRRRAATTVARGSSAYPKFRDVSELSGLSPRPAGSAQGRGAVKAPSREEGEGEGEEAGQEEEDPGQIGRAITSDGQLVQHKRRSRSLSGLLDLDITEVRRRSDEIRYWRESYGPGYMSPISSDGPDGDDPGAVFVTAQRPGSSDQARTALQPFNFGGLGMPGELTSMKITEAASLKTRITTLETRVGKLESLLSRAGGPRRPLTCETGAVAAAVSKSNTHNSNPSSPQSLGPSEGAGTHMSFGEGARYGAAMRPSIASAAKQQQQQPQPPPPARPVSNSTLRGVASLPSLSLLPPNMSSPVTRDQYNSLLALFNRERVERQELASQLQRLERRIALVGGGGSNGGGGGSGGGAGVAVGHIAHRRASLQLEPPPTARSFGDRSVFEQAERAEEGGGGHAKLAPEDSGIATHSNPEGHDQDEDEDDDSYSEEFRTPHEGHGQSYGFGAFGEELRETKGSKKAARTLSLSQLTLRHGQEARE